MISDKRIDNAARAMQLQITALGQMDRKLVPHELAYALIESAFWVMAEHEDRAQYLDEVFNEVMYWDKRPSANQINTESMSKMQQLN